MASESNGNWIARIKPALDSAWIVPALLAGGLFVRITWLLIRPVQNVRMGEATNVAIALAEKGQFADAYFPGQGPTAHLMPTTPLIAGMVYRLFGVDSFAADQVLAAWCLLQVFGSFLILFELFRRLGLSRPVRLGGLAALCLTPIFLGQETVDFRYWEGALAVNLVGLALIVVLEADRRGSADWGLTALACLLCALTFFVSPPLGVGAYAAAGIFALRNLEFRKTIALAFFAAAVLAAVLAPWALRNARVMGEPILLRDNAGLELAISNHAGAVDPVEPETAYWARVREVHPAHRDPQVIAAYYRAGGEAAYARKMGKEATAWIRDNPGEFAILTLRHFSQYYFPRPWQFRANGSGSLASQRAIFMAVLSILALGGMIAGWKRRDHRYLYIGVVLLAPGLFYAPFQPTLRYIYLIYGMMVFLAAAFVLQAIARLFASSGQEVRA